jgi:hypothetical protein
MCLFGPIIQLLVLYSANAIMSSEFNNFVELWSCNISLAVLFSLLVLGIHALKRRVYGQFMICCRLLETEKELNENGTEAVGRVPVGVHLMHKPPLWWQQVGDFQNFKESQVISLPNRVVAADNVSIAYMQLEVNSMYTSGLLLSHTLV